MSLLDRLFPLEGDAQLDTGGGYGVWASLFGYSKAASGVVVTSDTALTQATVYACIRVLSETLAQLPLQVYQRLPDGSRRRAFDHPLEQVLGESPNGVQTSFEFREMMQGHVALRGNAYAQIIAGPRGAVTELLPLHPGRVEVSRLTNGRLRYEVTTDNGGKQYLSQDQVFHLRNLSFDGIHGISPITYARDSIGLTLAAERYGSKSFSNGIKPSGMLTSKTANLTAQDAQKAQQTLMEAYAGESNWQKPIVMWGNLEWQQIGMTHEDAQFLATLDRGDRQACQIFRMPPHMVGILDRSTNNNIEQQSLEFVLYTMLPWVRRWEEAISRDLLTDPSYYIKFNLSGLLRGDADTRSKYYASMVNNGLLCPNEVRELEDRDPYEGGDSFFMQGAMVPVERLLNPPEPVPAGPTPAQQQQQDAQNQMHAVEIGKLTGEAEVYKSRIAQLTTEAADAAKAIDTANERTATLERELASQQAQVFALEADGQEASAEIESLRGQCRIATEELNAIESERQSAVTQLTEAERQLSEAQQQAAEAERLRQSIDYALQANAQIFCSRMRGLLLMEREHAQRAAKKPNFLEAVDQFYDQHYVRMLEAVEPIIQQRNALAGSQIDAAAFVASCQATSKESLLKACECQAEQLESSVADCVATWEGRIDQMLNHLTTKEADYADPQGNS